MSWWDDDPEVLNAALDMLASEENEQQPHCANDQVIPPATVSSDGDIPLLIPSPAPSSFPALGVIEEDGGGATSPPARPTERKTRQMINVTRERRRKELQYLREKAVELEAKLSILRHRRERMLRPHRSQTGEIYSVAAVWEELAKSQVRKLRHSELINAKLKKLVEMQLHIVQDLTSSIRRAEEESNRLLDQATDVVGRAQPRLAIDISQKVSEEYQLARLSVLCARWREAFTSTDKFHDGVSLRFLDVKLMEDNGAEAVLDVLSSWAAPFAKETVEEVFWQFFLKNSAEKEDVHAFAQAYESRDDTIISVFRALSTIDNHQTTFDGKYVAKRLRCPEGHMMVVSHMYGEPRCTSKSLEDVVVEEDWWLRVIEPHEVGGPKLTHPLTVLQHVRRVTIRFGQTHFEEDNDTSGSAGQRRRAGALTDFLVLYAEHDMKHIEHCVENMLLNSFNAMAVSSPAIPSPDALSVTV